MPDDEKLEIITVKVWELARIEDIYTSAGAIKQFEQQKILCQDLVRMKPVDKITKESSVVKL